MNVLLEPNVAYFLLVSGVILAILALFAPGTGIIEIGALFSLVLAGYGMYNLPMNIWALGMLLCGAAVFMVVLRYNKRKALLVVAILGLIVGSIFIFHLPDGSPAVNPIFATLVSGGAAVFLWFVGRKGIEAITRTPIHMIEHVLGKTGNALTEIWQEGTVYVKGEEWSARSETHIRAGTKIRVSGREGLTLVVEAVED